MLGFRRRDDVPLTVEDFIDDYEEKTGRIDVCDYARTHAENRIPTRYYAALALIHGELQNGAAVQDTIKYVVGVFCPNERDTAFFCDSLRQEFRDSV